jgi:thiosulfate reductase/polysulfide reductase chain A
MSTSRRQFIQYSGGLAGAAAAASGLTTDLWGLSPDRMARPNSDGDHVVSSFCELCFWKCGINAHVRDGRVTKIVGNPDHPLSRGRLCPRGTGGTGLLYDPDRLRTPLVRQDKRGAQVFTPVSWDDALDEVAERMLLLKAEHGPEALALFSHGYGGSWFKHLVKAAAT